MIENILYFIDDTLDLVAMFVGSIAVLLIVLCIVLRFLTPHRRVEFMFTVVSVYPEVSKVPTTKREILSDVYYAYGVTLECEIGTFDLDGKSFWFKYKDRIGAKVPGTLLCYHHKDGTDEYTKLRLIDK